jgi:hypothetical protein
VIGANQEASLTLGNSCKVLSWPAA